VNFCRGWMRIPAREIQLGFKEDTE
jgi:hypothetical protein